LTLIATAVSQHGIVHAADPTLTSYPRHIAAGRRIFKLAFASGALAVTGRYTIGGKPLDEWIVGEIDAYAHVTSEPTLSDFAEWLRQRLSHLPDPISRRAIHLSGYANEGKRVHPEVHYIRNVSGRAHDGGYGRPSRQYLASEEFWSSDYARDETRETLGQGGARMYLDGFPAKRVEYMLLHKRIHDFYRQLWQSSESFRSPRSLGEIASLVELDMRVTATFLGAGTAHHPPPVVTGPEMGITPAPVNAVRL
jgi:hypothetical protein